MLHHFRHTAQLHCVSSVPRALIELATLEDARIAAPGSRRQVVHNDHVFFRITTLKHLSAQRTVMAAPAVLDLLCFSK